MSEHPPSQGGGAPLIAKQHLNRYDQASLHILCDDQLYRAARRSPGDVLLPCAHTTVRNLERLTLRPRRVFGPLFDVANLARIPLIKRKAHDIIAREGIEAIFTIPWRTDFAAAAYQVSRESNVPLYVFAMDDWEAMNQGPIVRLLTHRWHGSLLSQAHHLWVISPQMGDLYRERFGVEGEFLFHFVELDRFQRAIPYESGKPGELRLVYTGAVNSMFLGALERIAEWLNDGMVVNDRRVTLDLWGTWCPEHLQGPAFRWRGFAPTEDIPSILAGADALLLAITFSAEPALRTLVRSSLYTKTVDYLASGKPLIVVSPPDTAEVDYVRSVAWIVDTLTREQFARAIYDATESPDAQPRALAGRELVRQRHTAETMGDRFLSQFYTADNGGPQVPVPPLSVVTAATNTGTSRPKAATTRFPLPPQRNQDSL